MPRYTRGYFGGNVITKMAVEFLPEKEIPDIYTHSGLQLNNFDDYEFTAIEPVDINGFRIYLSFLPGIRIDLAEIFVIKSESTEKIPISNTPNNDNIVQGVFYFKRAEMFYKAANFMFKNF